MFELILQFSGEVGFFIIELFMDKKRDSIKGWKRFAISILGSIVIGIVLTILIFAAILLI